MSIAFTDLGPSFPYDLDYDFDDFDSDEPFSIDVRDHFAYSIDDGRWVVAVNNVGVRVSCDGGSAPTVAQLESAIAAATTLATLSTPDVGPSKVIDAVAMVGRSVVASFSTGTFTAPTGEALKLTGLGLEIGIEPASAAIGRAAAMRSTR
jgi:hypothetical protein